MKQITKYFVCVVNKDERFEGFLSGNTKKEINNKVKENSLIKFGKIMRIQNPQLRSY